MSPTEDQLRRALHDGEGAVPDADAVIRRGRAARVARRNKALVLASAAAAVLVVGGGITALAGRDPSATSSGARASVDDPVLGANGAAEAATRSAAGRPSGQPSAGNTDPAEGTPAPCPASPQLAPSAVARNEPLLPTDATTVRVCLYAPASGAAKVTHQRVLDETQSRALVAAVNRRAPQPALLNCPLRPYRIALIAADRRGRSTLAYASSQTCGLLTNGRTNRSVTDLLAPLIRQVSGG